MNNRHHAEPKKSEELRKVAVAIRADSEALQALLTRFNEAVTVQSAHPIAMNSAKDDIYAACQPAGAVTEKERSESIRDGSRTRPESNPRQFERSQAPPSTAREVTPEEVFPLHDKGARQSGSSDFSDF